MQSTRALFAQQRQPMIKFLGKRQAKKSVDHTPQVHPASPAEKLPGSFETYRKNAQQHGPLGKSASSRGPGTSGASLGPVTPPKGQYFDRDDLPDRFRRTHFSMEEMEAIESGGASMWT